ncbi:MAG: hypothetical protein IJX26_01445 [Clostridia bacterium]|nr:hypothetical protein [Clostridia bacterium]
MNTLGKIGIGALALTVGAGAVAGVCYYQVPSFRTKVDQAFNIGSSANIGNINNDILDDDSIKPITPEEFKTKYKFDLPTTFLGGQIFVKVLSSGNLLVSSSVCTSILFCNAETEEVTQQYFSFSNWTTFKELKNGSCLISCTETGSGLLLYNISDNSIVQLSINGYNYTMFVETENKYIAFSNKVDYVLFYDMDSGELSSIKSGVSGNIIDVALSTAGFIYIYSYHSSSVVYSLFKLDLNDFSVTRLNQNKEITDVSNASIIFSLTPLSNGNCLVHSGSSNVKLQVYNYQTDTLSSLGWGYNTVTNTYQLTENKYLISSTSSVGLYLFNSEDNSLTEIMSEGKDYKKIHQYKNGDMLFCGYTGVLVYFKAETEEITVIGNILQSSISGGYRFKVLSNGNILFYSTSGSRKMSLFNYAE